MAKSGGSNRDVVFTIVVKGGPDADRVLDAYGKKLDALRQKAQIGIGMSAGNPYGGAGGGGPYRPTGGGSTGTTYYGPSGGSGGQGGVGGRGGRSTYVSELDRDFDALEKKWAAFEKKRQQDEKKALSDRRRQLGAMRESFGEALEGVTQLGRAFVLLGVSGEENLEKALRSLAKFEAAASGIRGAYKIGRFAGQALQYGGAAGGAGALGAAAVAAGVGVAGGAAAIYDTIRYNRTGQIGAYSQGYANLATGLAGTLGGYGIDPRQRGAAGFASSLIPGVPLLAAGGFYGAADAQSAAERSTMRSVGGQMGRIQEDERRLAIEREILGLKQQELQTVKQMTAAANARKDAAAGTFAGQSPWDKNQILRLRNRFLDNPDSLNESQIAAIQPYIGNREQRKSRRILRDRAGKAGLFDRGFQQEDFAEDQQRRYDDKGFFDEAAGIRLDPATLQREYVITLKTANDAAIKQLEDVLTQAYKEGNDDFDKKLKEMEERFNRDLERIRSQRRGDNNSAANGLGG